MKPIESLVSENLKRHLWSSITLQVSSIKLLESIYSIGITRDDRNMFIVDLFQKSVFEMKL
jgi:hypothetical protein